MATDTAPHSTRLRVSGVRSLDHIQAGVRGDAKPVAGRHRIRVHVPRGPFSRAYHIVLAWAIIVVTSGAGGVVVAALTTKGH